ncbi:MAG: helix-turn-helix transcriptional regulator [Pseudomonadaceae bacterium]|jgi:DNA-binding XRE family transcriptional regulator|nr:helix-turn-helix transcriptional regulator [Pseudomonadaceae bacterium]
MNVQVISRDGEPEYAVLPWAQYQALLKAAGITPQVALDNSPAKPPMRNASLREMRALREGLSLSLEALARSVGISPHYLEQIENGEREAGEPILRPLARALGIAGWSSPE